MRDAYEWVDWQIHPTRPRKTRTDGAPEVLRLSKRMRVTGGPPAGGPEDRAAWCGCLVAAVG